MMKQLRTTDISVQDFFHKILKVSSLIPTKCEVDDVINNFYEENKVPTKTKQEIDNVLQIIGIDKCNQEGLDSYVSNLITKNSGLSVDKSSKIVNAARILVVDYLKREELQKEIVSLKNFNEDREIELKKEIEYLNTEINRRIAKQKRAVEKFQLQMSQEELSTDEFIGATEIFLDIDLNREKTKIDVQRFLNGDNIVIEL